jgi:hypothetical protein
MKNILVGTEGTLCHMDDILVYGSSLEEHDNRLVKVLKLLQEVGMTLNREKCEFAIREVRFLGHLVNADGISADPAKVQAIKEFPPPKSKKELRRFLGVVNYLSKFSARLADLTPHMRLLLGKSSNWWWDESLDKEFALLKKALVSTPILAPFFVNAEVRLSTDASSFGLGAAIMQKHGQDWRPVAYASRTMTPAEKRYAQIEKEALAICWASDKFHYFLAGRKFQVETDHKPLLSVLGTNELSKLPIRLQRFRLKMMSYDYDMTFTPGPKIVLADMLSRGHICEVVDAKGLFDDGILDALVEALPCHNKGQIPSRLIHWRIPRADCC